MKKLVLLLLVSTIALVSCTQEEMTNDSTNEAKMLESYVIKRNANGSYTLTHDVANGVGSVYNDDSRTHEIQLYFDGSSSSISSSKDYQIIDNELNINFKTENNSFSPNIKIIDDNTADMANARGTYGLLNDYAVSENADGSIQIDFEVEAGVEVQFSYDDVAKTNNINLISATGSTQVNHSSSFQREADGSLRIDFVQPAPDNARSTDYKKPRIIMETMD